MHDRRTARATRLLDPVWHQTRDALDKLYAEIEPGAHVGALSVTVENLDGTVVAYTVEFTQPATILRHIITDPQRLIDGVDGSTVDASVGGSVDV
jgi:hypothetical protein